MKKVLSIDGGGIRGIIPGLLLAEIEARTGQPIAETFDMIAGTSTGGILALGLCKDRGNGSPQYPATELVDLYEKRGGEIFHRSLWQKVTSLWGWRDQAYSHEALEGILEEYFGTATLGQALKPVLITTYDIKKREPFFFKSWRPDRQGVEMRYAARATSAAPTFFEPAPVVVDGTTRYLVDGGVFVNNPAMCAHASARRWFKKEPLLIVSLGTGELNTPYEYEQAKRWGKAKWLVPVMDIMFDGVSDVVSYQLRDILAERFFRIQSKLERDHDAMDDASGPNITYLMEEGRRTIRDNADELAAICDQLKKGGRVTRRRRAAPRRPLRRR
jgi:patatin-like phospholipase/acyl hydrolase